jgi:hypothetical protein
MLCQFSIKFGSFQKGSEPLLLFWILLGMLEKQTITSMLSLISNFCNIKNSTYSLLTNLHWRFIKGEGLFGHLDDEGLQFYFRNIRRSPLILGNSWKFCILNSWDIDILKSH